MNVVAIHKHGTGNGPAAFEFRLQVPLGEEIARIVRGQISVARRALTQAETPVAVRVHDARTACKRIRAALAVAGAPRGRSFLRLTREFRDLGRSLSGIRDAMVMKLTFEALRGDYGGRISRHCADVVGRLIARQRSQAVSDRIAVSRTLSTVAARLASAARHLGVVRSLALDVTAPAQAFAASYRRARGAFLRQGPSPHSTHRWRKRSKVLLHLCALLAPWRPSVFRAWRRELSSLDDLLGQEHDLFVLDLFLKGRRSDANSAEIRAFRRWIDRRRINVKGRADELGRLIFSAKPREIEYDLSAWLKLAVSREYPLSADPFERNPGKGAL
jgi:CHAD domain-containing protein